MTRKITHLGVACVLIALLAVLPACSARTLTSTTGPTGHGMLGHARQIALDEKIKPIDRMLREATLGVLTLADGLPEQAEEPFNRVYETLRTRGVNVGRDGAAVVLHEGVRTWKGEPYEQALLYVYVAIQQAMIGSWGNARAAAGSALEMIDEFDAARGVARGLPGEANGYVTSQSDFVPALLIAGVANAALGRGDEASDYFDRVDRVRPRMEPVTATLRSGDYDSLIVVEMGVGPGKEAAGGDGAVSQLTRRWPSDERELRVRTSAGELWSIPLGLDVNRFAEAYRWDHLAKARQIKSGTGTLMTGAGAVMLMSDDDGVRWAGLGLLLGGLLTKAGSQADTRSLSVLPQRYYCVPIRSDDADAVEFAIGARSGESMVVPLKRERGRGPTVGIVRIPADEAYQGVGRTLDRWHGEQYSASLDVRVPGDELPYILGGRCVMEPGHDALAKYQASGFLLGMTSADLMELYRLEGIELAGEVRPGVPPGRHLLEGGRSLAMPLRTSLGYVRLMCRPHRTYQPKSDRVAALTREIQANIKVQAQQGVE